MNAPQPEQASPNQCEQSDAIPFGFAKGKLVFKEGNIGTDGKVKPETEGKSPVKLSKKLEIGDSLTEDGPIRSCHAVSNFCIVVTHESGERTQWKLLSGLPYIGSIVEAGRQTRNAAMRFLLRWSKP